MKILIRSDDETDWKIAEPQESKAEMELQKLILESPSIVSIEDIRGEDARLVAAVGEFGLPGSGNTDVLAFSPAGDIVIVECKLAANPEAKRKVIGQILEYASYLWGMSFEELNSRIFNRIKGKNLVDLIQEKVEEGWDEEDFRAGVEESLKKGSFILVIAVDKINEELRRIIEYMNKCSESVFSLHAIEMFRFKLKGLELMAPHMYGIPDKDSAGLSSVRWTPEKFFSVLEENISSEISNLVRKFYNVWEEKNNFGVVFGIGRTKGSLIVYILRKGKRVIILNFTTTGKLVLRYDIITKQLGQSITEEFHKKLQEMRPFKKIPPVFERTYPNIMLEDAFAEPEYVEKFRRVIEWMGRVD